MCVVCSVWCRISWKLWQMTQYYLFCLHCYAFECILVGGQLSRGKKLKKGDHMTQLNPRRQPFVNCDLCWVRNSWLPKVNLFDNFAFIFVNRHSRTICQGETLDNLWPKEQASKGYNLMWPTSGARGLPPFTFDPGLGNCRFTPTDRPTVMVRCRSGRLE